MPAGPNSLCRSPAWILAAPFLTLFAAFMPLPVVWSLLMSLPEKVGQLLMLDAQHGDLADIVSAKLAGSVLRVSPALMPEAMELARQTRLGIPLLTADDGVHGHSFWPGATIFPTQPAMACTWDPALLRWVARAAATEIAATGIHGTFSPVLCITRDLRWGRINETFGEHPVLIGELGAAMVRGYQGEGLSDPTAVLAYVERLPGGEIPGQRLSAPKVR